MKRFAILLLPLLSGPAFADEVVINVTGACLAVYDQGFENYLSSDIPEDVPGQLVSKMAEGDVRCAAQALHFCKLTKDADLCLSATADYLRGLRLDIVKDMPPEIDGTRFVMRNYQESLTRAKVPEPSEPCPDAQQLSEAECVLFQEVFSLNDARMAYRWMRRSEVEGK